MKRCVVIIPALNEERTIGAVIDAIPNTLFDGNVRLEVVVVNDGSSDRTEEVAKEHGASVISHDCPSGVGISFFDGVREALKRRADYAVNIDADGQMDSRDIERLLFPIFGGVSDMVTASRFMEKEFYPDMPAVKRWGNDRVAAIISFIVGKRYYDVSCGFRAYNREALLRLNLYGRFTYTQETFINLVGSGQIRISEISVNIHGEREYGKSRVASNVAKYALRSGSIILSAFKDYKPIKFFGGLSTVFFLIGLFCEILFFAHYLATGYFRNFLFLGLIGAFMAIVAMIFFILMILSDTLGKIFRTQEEILYLNKRDTYYGDLE